MIKYEEIYNATKSALEKGQFYELLTGKAGYDVPVLDTSADIPTDWTVVISNGIYQLYAENKNVYTAFIRAIDKMLGEGSTESWMVANILFHQLKHEKRGTSPFVLPDDILLRFNRELQQKKDDLSHNLTYGGEQYPNGLLGDIERLNRMLSKKYAISMII